MANKSRPAVSPRRRVGGSTPDSAGRAAGNRLRRSPQVTARAALLTREEEVELARRFHDEGDKEAFRTLVERNVGLVGSIARGYRDRGLDYGDLMQEGNVGLIRAIKKFDITKDCKLSTYATYWIRESIVRAVSANGSPFRLPTEKLNRIRSHQAVLRQGLRREPTPEELAESLGDDGTTVQDIRNMLDATQPVSSMDIRVGESGSSVISDLIADDRVVEPTSELVREELHELLEKVLRGLPDRERQVIEKRFSLEGDCPDTLEHLAGPLNITKEGVRQLERKALRSLRKTLLERGVDIRDFLAA